MRKPKLPVFDLHGYSVDEVFDLLNGFIKAQKNKERVCIIVGKGKGIIKEKTIEYLEQNHYAWMWENIGGIENKGALIVDLF